MKKWKTARTSHLHLIVWVQVEVGILWLNLPVEYDISVISNRLTRCNMSHTNYRENYQCCMSHLWLILLLLVLKSKLISHQYHLSPIQSCFYITKVTMFCLWRNGFWDHSFFLNWNIYEMKLIHKLNKNLRVQWTYTSKSSLLP